uniref:Probable DNA-directed RNA polymerase subunit delta n=1 Tax=Nicotiana tabacum TaxID=4097 RepID=A0A1S4C176_TOBAC|nr:PREDICTED: probable DNA-directed RNA polymerase subunit delta [Nicotiana tabacum]
MIQDVPLWTRTFLYEDDYNGQIMIPRIKRLQEEWNDPVTIPMGQNSWCTLEYYVWINEEEELAHPSREGSIDHMLPSAKEDDRVVECIQIESSIEPEQDLKEESECNDDEGEFEEDPEEEPEEEKDTGKDSVDGY